MDLDQGFKGLILGYQDPQILGLIPSKISSRNLFLKIGLLVNAGRQAYSRVDISG